MSSQTDRIHLFDDWAAGYDTAVTADDHSFPFAGYEQVLTTTFMTAQAQPAMRILDLGVGTGNLAAHFIAVGCQRFLDGHAGSGAGSAATTQSGAG
ncbi:MAG: hypothetical protein IAE79_02665 [Anaerolinea sp.]|nr:hypothetical protein [Anaerolinea sp.]